MTDLPGPNNKAYDCLGWGNANPDFQAGPNIVYDNCVHGDPLYVDRAARDYRIKAGSAAIGLVQPARFGWLPAVGIDGRPRVTADAGAYAA